MKKVILILPILFSIAGFSQKISPVFEDTSFEGSRISISSFNYYASNRFNNDLTDKFIFGGEITPAIKDHVSNKLKRINSLGGEAVQKIEYYNGDLHPLGIERFGVVASISDNHLVSSNFSTDLFRTTFYGNADYLNDTMDFSFSHFQYQHYQKYSIGIFEKHSLSSIKISYVTGSRTIEGRLGDSWLLSEQDTVRVNMVGTGYSTYKPSPYFAFQGTGFSIDLTYNFLFETKNENKHLLNLSLNNLGLIVWNEYTTEYKVDSTIDYTGFNIQDFINQPENSNNTYNFQDTLGIQSSSKKWVKGLPIAFSLEKLPMRKSPQKLQYTIGFKTILTSDYFPYIYGGLYYSIIDDFTASTRISYGGFGGIKWGLNLNYWIKDLVYIGIGTHDMIGYISKKHGYGRSINFSAHFNF